MNKKKILQKNKIENRFKKKIFIKKLLKSDILIIFIFS
jgi:hypothetical protein